MVELRGQGLRAEVGDTAFESVPAAVLGRVGTLALLPPLPSLLPSAATDSRVRAALWHAQVPGPLQVMSEAGGHGALKLAVSREDSMCGKHAGRSDQRQSLCQGRDRELRWETPGQRRGRSGAITFGSFALLRCRARTQVTKRLGGASGSSGGQNPG